MSVDEGRAPHLVALADGWSLWRLAALRGAGIPFGHLSAFAHGHGPAQMLAEPRFLEALAWQNPTALDNWIARHAASLSAGLELRRRGEHDRLLARYAQRYCGKNDTIGFFGPVAWARFEPGRQGASVSGGGGIRKTDVRFEYWSLRQLADRWESDDRSTPHLPVRMHPAVSVEDGLLRRPGRTPRKVTDHEKVVFAELRPGMALGELAGAVSVTTGLDVPRAYVEIDRLRRERALCVGFVVPMDDRPHVRLRAQVDRVTDADVRGRLAADLAAMEDCRDGVADAVGDPVAVRQALAELSMTLSTATGGPSVRAKARHPVGRTPVYHDCRRDHDVAIGDDLLRELRMPLALVLRTAQWLAAEVGAAIAQAAMARYRRLRRDSSDIRLDRLYLGIADQLSGSPGTVVHSIVEDFGLRWTEVVRGEAQTGPIRLVGTDVADRIAALFPDAPVRWSAARQHSPDLMLARVEGGWQWVLGELHVAINTLENRVFHTLVDDFRELHAAFAADMARGRVVALHPVDSPEVTPRTYPPVASHVPETYRYWSYGLDAGPPSGTVSWPATALRVSEQAGELVVEPPDGSWRATLLETLGEFLSALVADLFQPFPRGDHTPRVLIDNFVVSRERWRFPASALPGSVTEPDRLVAALRSAGLPRHLFVSVPTEPKPVYVDLESHPMVQNLARLVGDVRRAGAPDATVDLVEMLPGPDHLWLTDAEGERYTSELRVVAVTSAWAPTVIGVDA